jgi:nitrite reductase/ring-hydroxylating ferredoxin subunit
MIRKIHVAALNDLVEEEGFAVQVDGCPVAVFRCGSEVHAVGNVCPHMGAPLSDGYVDGRSVVCPWHGWVFDLRTGVSPFDEDAWVPVYRVVVEAGEVYLEVEETESAPEPSTRDR